jgi:CBS domain-containing protein
MTALGGDQEQAMKTMRLTLRQTVGEVMNGTPVTLPPGARIREAVRRFTDEGPEAIAIVDAGAG